MTGSNQNLSKLLRAALIALGLASGSCSIYAPKLLDCKVRCGDADACPVGTTCESGYCRPANSPGQCLCTPGEERACGGGLGECVAGNQRCSENKTWGACLGETKPSAEICDGKDNDCDGMVDEDVTDAPPCEKRLGVCAGKVKVCIGGAYGSACADADYGPDYEPIETRCDGKDNDCDGLIDGRPPFHLVSASKVHALTGFDGGYGLVWSEALSNGSRQISGRLFNGQLKPLGLVTTLGLADAGVSVEATSYGGRAWFTWEKNNANDVAGVYVDVASPNVAVPIPSLPRTDATGSLSIAANAQGLVGAYPINDGGVRIVEWPNDGGAAQARTLFPPVARLLRTSYVLLSSRASAVGLYGDTDDDAGSTNSYNGVMAVNGSRYSDNYVYTSGNLLDQPNGLRAIWSYSNYFFFFGINESGITAKFEAWDGGSKYLRTISDYSAIGYCAATTTPTDWAIAWPERGSLEVGTPLQAAGTLRYKTIDLDGGVAASALIANSGGGLSAVVFTTDITTGALDGVLVCPP